MYMDPVSPISYQRKALAADASLRVFRWHSNPLTRLLAWAYAHSGLENAICWAIGFGRSAPWLPTGFLRKMGGIQTLTLSEDTSLSRTQTRQRAPFAAMSEFRTAQRAVS